VRSLAAGVVAAFLAGCGVIQQPSELAPNFLQLQSFVAVDSTEESLEGFLRWLYVADDPGIFPEPGVYCEVWEHLLLSSTEPSEHCIGCVSQFDGVATVDPDSETTCEDVGWTQRDFSLAFGSLELVEEPDRSALQEDGYSHAVFSRWSPDLGWSQGFQELFAATPELWAPEEGELGGTDEAVEGQYELFSLYYWDLRSEDSP